MYVNMVAFWWIFISFLKRGRIAWSVFFEDILEFWLYSTLEFDSRVWNDSNNPMSDLGIIKKIPQVYLQIKKCNWGLYTFALLYELLIVLL